jgi:hypothetical protein
MNGVPAAKPALLARLRLRPSLDVGVEVSCLSAAGFGGDTATLAEDFDAREAATTMEGETRVRGALGGDWSLESGFGRVGLRRDEGAIVINRGAVVGIVAIVRWVRSCLGYVRWVLEVAALGNRGRLVCSGFQFRIDRGRPLVVGDGAAASEPRACGGARAPAPSLSW